MSTDPSTIISKLVRQKNSRLDRIECWEGLYYIRHRSADFLQKLHLHNKFSSMEDFYNALAYLYQTINLAKETTDDSVLAIIKFHIVHETFDIYMSITRDLTEEEIQLIESTTKCTLQLKDTNVYQLITE